MVYAFLSDVMYLFKDIRVAEKMKKIIGPNRGLKW